MVRSFSILTLLVILALPMYSQTSGTDSAKVADPVQTLIPHGELHSGGFGALVVKVGAIDGQTSVLFGGRGGWVINRTFVIGGGGYGYTDMMHHNQNSIADTGVSFGYGGLELEYLISSSNVVHATVMTLIGAGGLAVMRRYPYGPDNDYNTIYSTSCFVFEPAVNVEVNILTWLRLGIGGGYRFVTGIDAVVGAKTYDNSTVSGLFGAATLKFGPY
ncbi:MAG TPA: hypothetical protein VK147_12095 [Candidatus Didemnitutus sp.]|nr:hypothetical protein [Candidatus Didemnitutus sp.]